MRILLTLIFAFSVTACSTKAPEGIEPVSEFDVSRYLGKWYEIARLDHRFERGLTQVSADYQLRESGGIRVLNRGYSADEDAWQEAEGKAFFVSDETIGHLKVSFFGPFYGAYVIFELDHDDYQYAYIAGPNRDYLWFLSRCPKVSEAQIEQFVATAKAAGFDTEALIFVEQQDAQP